MLPSGTGRLRCAVLDDYQDAAPDFADWSRLDGKVDVTRFSRHLGDDEGVAAALKDFDIVVAMRERTPFGASLLKRLPRLRLLITTGMVNASFDMPAAAAAGITVCGTRSSLGSAAELSWGLLLALTRRIVDESQNFRAGGERWQVSVGSDLRGRTLAVAGIGKVGERVARYGKAFEMNVIGWSPNNTPERSAALGIGYAASLRELIEAADVLSLHVPLTEQTRGFIGPVEFGWMKQGAILINTGRGRLVDEAALIDALTRGKLGGAGLDVYTNEPLPKDHPLRRLPNVVATPHIGYVTSDTYAGYYYDAVEDIECWLTGEPVRVLATGKIPEVNV